MALKDLSTSCLLGHKKIDAPSLLAGVLHPYLHRVLEGDKICASIFYLVIKTLPYSELLLFINILREIILNT